MIKLTFCLRRRSDLSREAFQHYWRETHAPLVAARAQTLGVRRYVQVHTADLSGLHRAFQTRNDGSPEPFDGVAELWFDSLDDLGATHDARATASAELLADERNFIDLSNSPIWIGEEHVVVATTQTGAAPILGCTNVDAVIEELESIGFECPNGARFGGVGDEGTVYATLALDRTPLHLQIRRRPLFSADRESIETDVYLYVDDVHEMRQRCLDAGVTIFRDLVDEPYGLRDFAIELREGQRLAIGTPISG